MTLHRQSYLVHGQKQEEQQLHQQQENQQLKERQLHQNDGDGEVAAVLM